MLFYVLKHHIHIGGECDQLGIRLLGEQARHVAGAVGDQHLTLGCLCPYSVALETSAKLALPKTSGSVLERVVALQ